MWCILAYLLIGLLCTILLMKVDPLELGDTYPKRDDRSFYIVNVVGWPVIFPLIWLIPLGEFLKGKIK